MTKLEHWVFATDFSAHEAAYLILGVDPSRSTDDVNAKHIKERMKRAYLGAFDCVCFECHVVPFLSPFDDDFDIDEGREKLMPKHETLESVEMRKLLDGWSAGNEVAILSWIEKGRNNFFEQRFSRSELARWIAENQLVSAYQFATALNSTAHPNVAFTAQSNPASSVSAQLIKTRESEVENRQKPLSNRERDTLLTIIAVLCKEAKLDYSKSAKTAGLIQSTAATMGVSIGETTIENHLKKIPDALGTRTR